MREDNGPADNGSADKRNDDASRGEKIGVWFEFLLYGGFDFVWWCVMGIVRIIGAILFGLVSSS